jgi:hypothetical protein
MTLERRAQILTVLVLAGAAGVAYLRQANPRLPAAVVRSRPEPTPQDAVYAMLEAAKAGDVSGYVASHAGDAERSLRRAMAESADFSQYLRRAHADIKGIAVGEPQETPEQGVRVRVEFVFDDRDEVQFLSLDRTAVGWKITRVDAAERIEAPVRYGTVVQ